MNLTLKQIDITLNQYHNPYYEMLKISPEGKQRFEEDIYNRINKRLHQIDCLRLLKNNNLTDKEFYNLITEVYYLSYNNTCILNTNLLSDYDLSIILRVSSKKELDFKKFYDMSEIEELLNNEEVLLEDINIVEYDYDWYKMTYGIEREDFKHIEDDNLGRLYSIISTNYSEKQLKNEKIIKTIRESLTTEKINNDLINLIKLTNSEFIYLKNIDSDIEFQSLTY